MEVIVVEREAVVAELEAVASVVAEAVVVKLEAVVAELDAMASVAAEVVVVELETVVAELEAVAMASVAAEVEVEELESVVAELEAVMSVVVLFAAGLATEAIMAMTAAVAVTDDWLKARKEKGNYRWWFVGITVTSSPFPKSLDLI